jgi:uncharacterized protein (TIGR03790 family)
LGFSPFKGDMRTNACVTCVVLGAVWIAASARAVRGEIGPDNVLVLYNQASPEGTQIANYYAQTHPGVHLLALSGIGTAETISADSYLSAIRPQVLSALTPSIDLIVTTKGLPLRISEMSHANPGAYTDPAGVRRTVLSSCWKPYSSLESELTRIDTISTGQQMGDQTLLSFTGLSLPAVNPYYKSAAPFDFGDYRMRLTARLDGFTVPDVEDSIDRAQRAFIMESARWFVLDNDPTAAAASTSLMRKLRSSVLAPRGQDCAYDNTAAALTSAPGPVIGYVSYGTNNGSGALRPGYVGGQLQFGLADGAVFQTYESYNAYSF